MKLSYEEIKNVLADVCSARGYACPELHVENFWPNLASIDIHKGGGNVIIGRNLIDMLDTEDELAAVLAHELSHHEADGFDEWSAYMMGGAIAGWQVHMDKEKHADLGAVDLLHKLGRNPHAVSRMLEKIVKRDPRASTSDMTDGARYLNVERYIADLGLDAP